MNLGADEARASRGGFYLSGHPLDQYAALWIVRACRMSCVSRRRCARATHARLAGTLLDMDIRRTRTGSKDRDPLALDRSGQFEAMLFSEMLAKHATFWSPASRFSSPWPAMSMARMCVCAFWRWRISQPRCRNRSAGCASFSMNRARECPQWGLNLWRFAQHVEAGGEGQVELRLRMNDGGEVHMRLPAAMMSRVRLSPPPRLAACWRSIRSECGKRRATCFCREMG